MSRPGKELVHDFEVVAGVDLVGGHDAVFTVDCKDGDRDHQVTGKLEGVGLCERKIVRHRDRLHSGAGQFPLDGSEKALRRARSPRRQSQEAAAR